MTPQMPEAAKRGRPMKFAEETENRVRELLAADISMREIQRLTGVPKSTVCRIKARGAGG